MSYGCESAVLFTGPSYGLQLLLNLEQFENIPSTPIDSGVKVHDNAESKLTAAPKTLPSSWPCSPCKSGDAWNVPCSQNLPRPWGKKAFRLRY